MKRFTQFKNKTIGQYFEARGRTKKKLSKIKRKLESSRSALRAVWYPAKGTQAPKIDHIRRLQRYFHFCEDIENHSFYKAYVKGGKFELNVKADPAGDSASVNFDEFHLESLLTRLRQFLFENELYFLDDMSSSVRITFGSDCMFEDFLKKLKANFGRPIVPKKSNVQVFLPNGEEAVGGRNIYELIEMELYTGRIHSQHTADPSSPYFSLAGASVIVRKNVTYYLGSGSMNAAANVLIFRNHILRLARIANQTSAINELSDFDQKMKALGF